MGAAVEYTITSEPAAAEAPSTSTAERPANVPEKFWDPERGAVNTEALLASYSALESKLGTPKPGTEETTEAATEEPETATEASPEESKTGDEEADKIVTEAGLDVEAIEAHWLEHQTLPEAELEKLAKVGVTKEMAEEFIGYRVAQAERVREEVLSAVGGAEVVDKMVEWAGKTYSQEKAASFNAAVNSKDRGQIEMALKALKVDFDKANPSRPKLVKPAGNLKSTAGDRFESLDQLLAAQADPRYRTDAAYREAVIAKLSRSYI
jgi:hypothetical protein